ncbi:hypothetical protein JTE90_027289 [Oedothorax gibbosus]|uniref:Uncharacterized protein n=1 Tax=Oedothorax gibbosus TaxID=931172 RepID=A0AAV6W0S0_9ARAC|nr:hypothetical protein JTE90_027289 [Oedothorax gibbosus]
MQQGGGHSGTRTQSSIGSEQDEFLSMRRPGSDAPVEQVRKKKTNTRKTRVQAIVRGRFVAMARIKNVIRKE